MDALTKKLTRFAVAEGVHDLDVAGDLAERAGKLLARQGARDADDDDLRAMVAFVIDDLEQRLGQTLRGKPPGSTGQ